MKKIILGSVVVCNLLFSTVVDNGSGNSYGGGLDSTINGDNNTISSLNNSNVRGDWNEFGNLYYSEIIGGSNKGNILDFSFIYGGNNEFENSHTSSIYGTLNRILGSIGKTTIYGDMNVIDTSTAESGLTWYLKVSGKENNIKNGTNSSITGNSNEIDGENIYHNGSYGNILGESNVSMGDNVSIIGNNSVALGSFSKATEDFTVSFGDVGSERKIVNVKAGVNDTDVVNVGQLNTNLTNTLNSAKSYTDTIFSSFSGTGGVSETLVDTKDAATLSSAKSYADTKDAATLTNAKNYADNGDARTLKEANSYTDSKISALEDSLTKEFRSATATAIALGVSPILSNGNKSAIGIGMGHYEGENAVAVNYVGEVNKNVHVQLGTALNSNSQAFKGGVSFGF